MKIPAPSARRLMPTRILKIVVLLFMSLVITELVFQFASRWVPAIDQVTASPWKVVPRWVKDESINGNRGNVEYWEHDDWGYRNETRLKNAKYVAMGDSFTYGTGVGRNEAWPPLLSEILKTPVYNMGVAARSPITYLTTFDRALSLNPRLVIVAVYLGNDFLESYWSRHFATRRQKWTPWIGQ